MNRREHCPPNLSRGFFCRGVFSERCARAIKRAEEGNSATRFFSIFSTSSVFTAFVPRFHRFARVRVLRPSFFPWFLRFFASFRSRFPPLVQFRFHSHDDREEIVSANFSPCFHRSRRPRPGNDGDRSIYIRAPRTATREPDRGEC